MAARKKKHWTQDPKNRAKLYAMTKKSAATRLAGKSTQREVVADGHSQEGEEPYGEAIAYALGHTQAWLEQYARHGGIPVNTLAYRVGQLLQRASRR